MSLSGTTRLTSNSGQRKATFHKIARNDILDPVDTGFVIRQPRCVGANPPTLKQSIGRPSEHRHLKLRFQPG